MTRTLTVLFAALLGLCFGSFLNVCLSRWPASESTAKPRSHCRSCGRTLAWWENIPLASWIALRGHCRTCGASISVRYPLVELAVGLLWATTVCRSLSTSVNTLPPGAVWLNAAGGCIFFWLLVALAVFDAEGLWLPDRLTLPGTAIGFAFTVARGAANGAAASAALTALVAIAAAAAGMLLIRGAYKLLRKREGLGLGDVKLMAMLAAWLGFSRTLAAFAVGVGVSLIAALLVLMILAVNRSAKSRDQQAWLMQKLPLGTFLCIGGVVSALCGQQIVIAYLHWAGF